MLRIKYISACFSTFRAIRVFPAVTLCNMNKLKRELLAESNNYKHLYQIDKILEEFQDVVSIDEEG